MANPTGKKPAMSIKIIIIAVVAIALVFVVISKFAIEQASVSFDEYWGSSIVSITEEEPYNYWKEETCSRQVPDGTDKDRHTKYRTEYYDCSHQEDVGPSWSAATNIGETLSITDKQYDELVQRFGTGKHGASSRCLSRWPCLEGQDIVYFPANSARFLE